ncbi:PspC domain-containing protein, partial [Micromonospora sp. NPDC047753]|uniref:PspC domain-containing protein n=1 Tax=Micromonospora sp. NPDC047753 TaxID=3154817 RepID=UPI0033D6E92C
MTSTTAPHAPYKQLRRPTTDRMVAGVASGVGRYFAVDPTLVRVIFAVARISRPTPCASLTAAIGTLTAAKPEPPPAS